MKKSNALKHVPISTIEQTIDEAMEYLPGTLNLSLPESRAKLRMWMVRVCGVVVSENARDFSKAATSAIEEAAALVINPKYHVEQKRRRDKYKAMRSLKQNSERPQAKAEAAFHRMNDAAVKM